MFTEVFFYLLSASGLATVIVFAACVAASSADEVQQTDPSARKKTGRGHQLGRPLTDLHYSL